MNFRETFLKLTEYTTPFGNEKDLEPFLLERVPDLKKDNIGNYHKIIGETETLFTCHLDNFCKAKTKVVHGSDDRYIYNTAGNILGADNKAGVCVLLYLIEQNVPGHYCFFVGEEPILSGGCYGSSLFAQNYKNITKYKRAIAFDRKDTSSIIDRQMGQSCCSPNFVDYLINEFYNNGIRFYPDSTGYYTDTASFLEYIPECTNISVGVFGEHTNNEYVDIRFVEKLAKAAKNINWEKLPYNRIPKDYIENEEILDEETNTLEAKLFNALSKILAKFSFLCMNKYPFNSNKIMQFNNWFKEIPIKIEIKNGIQKINDNEVAYTIKNDKITIDEESLRDVIILCRERLNSNLKSNKQIDDVTATIDVVDMAGNRIR